jgi:hypothetical protein
MLKESLNQFENILRGKTIKSVSAEYHRLRLTCEDGEEIIVKSELAKDAPLGCCLFVLANVQVHTPPQAERDRSATKPLSAVAVSRLVVPSSSSDYVNLGGGFRDDKNKVFYEKIGDKTYEIPFEHMAVLVTRIVTQGVMTGLLSLEYIETLLKGYEGVRGKKMMYSTVPLCAAPSSQQLTPSPVQNQ